jgi:hypothetical protein
MPRKFSSPFFRRVYETIKHIRKYVYDPICIYDELIVLFKDNISETVTIVSSLIFYLKNTLKTTLYISEAVSYFLKYLEQDVVKIYDYVHGKLIYFVYETISISTRVIRKLLKKVNITFYVSEYVLTNLKSTLSDFVNIYEQLVGKLTFYVYETITINVKNIIKLLRRINNTLLVSEYVLTNLKSSNLDFIKITDDIIGNLKLFTYESIQILNQIKLLLLVKKKNTALISESISEYYKYDALEFTNITDYLVGKLKLLEYESIQIYNQIKLLFSTKRANTLLISEYALKYSKYNSLDFAKIKDYLSGKLKVFRYESIKIYKQIKLLFSIKKKNTILISESVSKYYEGTPKYGQFAFDEVPFDTFKKNL